MIVLTNLHPDYVYECRVAAITVAQGPYTQTFAVRVLVSCELILCSDRCVIHICLFLTVAPSSPPLNFVATPADPRSIVLRWDPPLPEDRNGPITGYLIDVTVVETSETFQLNVTTTTLRVLELTPYTTYRFTIAASTEVGLGPFSTVYSTQTPEDGNN